jgi:hypothetical protein
MTKTTTKTLLVTLLSLSASTAIGQNSQGQNDDSQGLSRCRGCVQAPEIDPGQAMGALTLLTGAVTIVRGYRRRRK